ncbi:MAG: glycosyltransferase family 4 protein [Patescibacteria group bacterium]|jgi:glycosyltransferase involved in cell wall biosynthesis
MDKKKLLIISGCFPPDSGGPASLLPNLIPILMEHGYEVTVLTYGDQIDNLPYKVVRISRKTNKILTIIRLVWAALRLAKNSDKIYSLDVYWPGFAAMIAGKILRRKQIARFTGDSAWETANNQGLTDKDIFEFQKDYINFRNQVVKFFRNAILRNCRYVVTDSYFFKRLLMSFGVKEERILVAHNSVEYLPYPENFSKEKFKRENGLKEKVIITVSRLVPRKAVDRVIALLPRLKERVGEISFICIGAGPEYDNLKKQGSRLAEKYGLDIRLPGNLPRNQVLPWFLAADAFINYSHWDGIAHTLVEALYFKTPIIASRAGGNIEIIEDGFNGLLVDFGNEEQLFNSLIRILTDQELIKKFKNNSGEKLKNDFIWERVVEINLKALAA